MLLDRHAHSATLIRRPTNILIGGVLSLFISVEMPWGIYPPSGHVFEHGVVTLSESIKNYSGRRTIIDFIKMYRMSSTLLFMCRSGSVLHIESELLLHLRVLFRHLISPQAAFYGLSKPIEALKEYFTTQGGVGKGLTDTLQKILDSSKFNQRPRTGSNLTPEQFELYYQYAFDLFRHVSEVFSRGSLPYSPDQKRILVAAVSSILDEVNTLKTTLNSYAGAKTPSAVLIKLLTACMAITDRSREITTVSVGAITRAGGSDDLFVPQILQGAELLIHHANMISIIGACFAAGNRSVITGHVPILLVGLSFAISLIMDPLYYNLM